MIKTEIYTLTTCNSDHSDLYFLLHVPTEGSETLPYLNAQHAAAQIWEGHGFLSLCTVQGGKVHSGPQIRDFSSCPIKACWGA